MGPGSALVATSDAPGGEAQFVSFRSQHIGVRCFLRRHGEFNHLGLELTAVRRLPLT